VYITGWNGAGQESVLLHREGERESLLSYCLELAWNRNWQELTGHWSAASGPVSYGVFTWSSKRPAIYVYFEYICWKFTGRLLDRVNTLLVSVWPVAGRCCRSRTRSGVPLGCWKRHWRHSAERCHWSHLDRSPSPRRQVTLCARPACCKSRGTTSCRTGTASSQPTRLYVDRLQNSPDDSSETWVGRRLSRTFCLPTNKTKTPDWYIQKIISILLEQIRHR